MIILGFSPRNL